MEVELQDWKKSGLNLELTEFLGLNRIFWGISRVFSEQTLEQACSLRNQSGINCLSLFFSVNRYGRDV